MTVAELIADVRVVVTVFFVVVVADRDGELGSSLADLNVTSLFSIV